MARGKNMKFKFQETNPFEKRKQEADRIKQKYPDRIPVICEKVEGTDVPDIDKHKYLVPADLNMGQFAFVIRKRIQLAPEKAMFLFCGSVVPSSGAVMAQVYEEHKDEDGFLYLKYSNEHVFG